MRAARNVETLRAALLWRAWLPLLPHPICPLSERVGRLVFAGDSAPFKMLNERTRGCVRIDEIAELIELAYCVRELRIMLSAAHTDRPQVVVSPVARRLRFRFENVTSHLTEELLHFAGEFARCSSLPVFEVCSTVPSHGHHCPLSATPNRRRATCPGGRRTRSSSGAALRGARPCCTPRAPCCLPRAPAAVR